MHANHRRHGTARTYSLSASKPAFRRRIWLASLTAAALLLGLTTRLEASVITYRFSGTHYFHSGSFPGGTPSSFSGTFAYDTSSPVTTGGWTDQGIYIHAAPLGQSGISVTTDTGLTFATDPHTSTPTYDVTTATTGGPRRLFNETFTAAGATANVPAGWTYGAAYFDMRGPYGNIGFLNGSTALPASLPTFGSLAEMPYGVEYVSVQLEVFNPGVNIATFKGQVTSLQHVSTASETPVTSSGSPVTTTLDGGAGSLGGVTVGFTPSTVGTFQKVYNTVAADELPMGEPFTAGNFVLSVPGETLQYWDLHYTGALDGPATVTFQFDPTLVTQGLPLGIWHYVDSTGWEFLGGTVVGNQITVTTSSFSPFALGVAPVPEPATYVLGALGLVGLLAARRGRQRKS